MVVNNSGFQQESILNASVSDQAAAEDDLGFKPYVEAIAEFLTNPVTQPPLTISIEGEWGSGKSSFMKQLQKTIEEFQHKKLEKELQVNLAKGQVQAESFIRKFRNTNKLPKVITELVAFILKVSSSVLLNIYKWISLKLNKLESKPKTIWFNVWKHDKAEALWAAFALEFLRQLSIDRNIILFMLRYDWKNGFRFISLALIGLGTIVILGVIALLKGEELLQPGGEIQQILTQIFQKPFNIPIQQIFQPPVNVPLLLLRGVVFLFSGIGFISLLLKLLNVGDPKNELAKYLQTPNYENQVPFVEKFHEDFEKIVQAYAGKRKVYVFIDDLDRCEVPKSAELMQAINMMIANDPQLIFILGMDREKVAAGVALKYKDLIPYLIPYLSVDTDHQVSSISFRKSMEYGYAFLEKFIQIPFQVPQPTQSEFERFLVKISQPQRKKDSFWYSHRQKIAKFLKSVFQRIITPAKDEPEPETPIPQTPTTSTQRQKILKRREELKIEVTEDSQKVRDIILMIAPVLDYNPRRLKQFINLFRLKTYIASNTGCFDELTDESTSISYKSLTLEQLGKFTAISLKFPRLIIDLNSDRQLLKNLQHGALKNPADFSPYNETTKYWGGYQKLVELLRSPAVYLEPKSESMVIKDEYSFAEVDVDKLLQVSPGTQDDLSSERGIDYTKLRDYLKSQQLQEADTETYLVMLQAVGREPGDWLRTEELLNFPCTDLHTIDKLWLKYSGGKFGFSVQKEIYLSVGVKLDGSYNQEAWGKFCDRVGWVEDRVGWVEDIWYLLLDLPAGNLPRGFAFFAGVSSNWRSDYRLNWISSLASRLVNCNI
ncbi:P-loop NTPase fold protein [Umezakia ovalisporum]|uniref:GUN4 domain-containing protein n=2 Tax=Umezakia ovalisporum TaxID=75695 RepID=A0AA43H1L8_9CYAN|nr:GUN4 domain-containing protein [Umezakia ovalisporum]MDH6058022.1 GUN4 domain-containing protein [Umezakia ovalisporum FSS-43]MDH6065165.1 GUN4 domain-containing protein [Umezakia ovalisporum FSS-62]MDH6072045.1 GUN4 domain-containing protein [Umezakia ovalisporum CobakiLakeA]MDH6074164.1 GUN4 domain-containing protein [Umezakia ovalisporum CS-1034]MDH6082645.1 GUN4 domain-containing protein [Umezakia ovalisporum FSS-44]